MLIRRSILAFLFIAFSAAAIVSTHGQSAPSAFKQNSGLQVGGLGSVFQPDFYYYEGQPIVGTGPQRLYGAGAYADARFNRWAQIEVEARWLRFNEFHGIYQNTYSIGERFPIKTFHKFTPYGKVLAGLGNGSFLTGDALVLTYGGGVDYRLSRKFAIRCADFEYQQWSVSPTTIRPYGLSVGLSYKVF